METNSLPTKRKTNPNQIRSLIKAIQNNSKMSEQARAKAIATLEAKLDNMED
jgi:hypothetical protein